MITFDVQERAEDHLVVYLGTRYSGWVQRHTSGIWVMNYRHPDGTWADPHTERPGHHHRTRQAALDALLNHLTIQ